MRFEVSALVLGALLAGEAAASSITRGKAHNHAARHSEMLKGRSAHRQSRKTLNLLNTIDSALLGTLGLAGMGANPTAAGNVPWIADECTSPWSNTYYNQAEEDAVMCIWGSWGSWVNSVVPQITLSIPQNDSRTVCFPEGWSGAWAPIFPGTQLVNGQVHETWGEGTFVQSYGTVDVSREVNMNGRNMSIVTPQCTSDMNKCSFVCKGGAASCWLDYLLQDCSTSDQAGANSGYDNGAPSGGCSGMGDGAALKTYFGWTH